MFRGTWSFANGLTISSQMKGNTLNISIVKITSKTKNLTIKMLETWFLFSGVGRKLGQRGQERPVGVHQSR